MGGAAFSYITIFLLQLQVVWGAWKFRDLTSGDTADYFVGGTMWARSWRVPISWSPLYTSYYGTLIRAVGDAYLATTLHRLVIVLLLSVLVLALMRKLLPAGIAWLLAAWWVVLPIDFNSLYEVHLFAVIPVVVSLLAILWRPGSTGRGLALGILLVSAALVRNELALAVALLGALCLLWELRRLRGGEVRSGSLARAYGLPLLAACLLILVFFSRHTETSIQATMRRKHTLNVCQVYAFGYQQRHPEWTGSPWTECQELMRRDFGLPEPSMREALLRNPRAIAEHFFWNIKLIPSGLEVLLFNAMSGKVNPDYAPVRTSRHVLGLDLGALGLLAAASYLGVRERERWKGWLLERAWAWTAMACLASVAVVVMITQRPRPSYLFVLGLALRAAIGTGAWIVVSRWSPARLERLAPLLAVPLVLLVPPYWPRAGEGRPLLEAVRRLAPFRDALERPGSGLAASAWRSELCSYVGGTKACRPIALSDMTRQVTPERSLERVLAENGATVVYADEQALADPLVDAFVRNAASTGWRLSARFDHGGKSWAVMEAWAGPP